MASTTAIRAVARMRSPSLNAFETNPFRILRLAVTASTSEAAIHAEGALTLSRVGLPPEAPDLLPWLPDGQSFEIQQAAQAVEEPLIRLKHQLLWFDLVRDPKGGLLAKALADPGGELMKGYLCEELKPESNREADPAELDGLFAHAQNQANARLLSSSAAANGYFSSPLSQNAPVVVASSKWKPLGNFQSLAEAHTLFDGSGANFNAIQEDWKGALQRWSTILRDPRFKSHLVSRINELEDDYVSAEDVETVEESVRSYLADLAAQEARFFVVEGRYSLAASVISAVAHSGMELRAVVPAMRPLRQVFKSEISELDALVDSPECGADGVEAYIKRLSTIRSRWTSIDSDGVVGLRDILDQALEKAYFRLRTMDKTEALLDGLLSSITTLAAADSLRERVRGYEKELEESRGRLCHFCKTGIPDYEKCAVLRGKKETGRTRSYNTTTIHYSVRYALVLRCDRCAKLHAFVRKLGLALWFVGIPGVVAFLVALTGGSN